MRIRLALPVLASILIFASMTGCSSGGSGGGGGPSYRPLSQQESDRFRAVTESVGNVIATGDQFRAQAQTQALFQTLMAKAPKNPGAPSPIKKTVDQANCEVKVDVKENSSAPTAPADQPGTPDGTKVEGNIPTFKVEIGGTECPVRLLAALAGQQSDQGFQGTFTLQYEALTAEGKELNDVDKMDMSGVISVQIRQKSQSAVELITKVSLTGTGHSKKEGDFATSTTMDGVIESDLTMQKGAPPIQMAGFATLKQDPLNGMLKGQMSETFDFRFKDMAAQLRSVVRFAPEMKEEYFINGQAVSADEYKAYRDSLEIPGMDGDLGGGGPNEPEPAYALDCEARVYDAAKMPVEELERAIGRNELPAGFPLLADRSCNQTKQIVGPLNPVLSGASSSDSAMIDFSFANEYATASVRVCEANNGPCQSFEKSFLPYETKAYAKGVARYGIYLRCEARPACSAATVQGR